MKLIIAIFAAFLLSNIQSQKISDLNALPDRTVIVHLFEWKWTDIANECERFLGPNKFAGVQIAPPNEHSLIDLPLYRPWYQRYQPVSYKLISRGGDEKQFIDMVERCNKVGVRIYVDAVINHMSATYGNGSAGSFCDPSKFDYPAVPYTREHFHKDCPTNDGSIHNFENRVQVTQCDLVGLPDLDTSNEYVITKLTEFLNRLIDIGVAGFRIDAAKHIIPKELKNIIDKVNNVREDIFGKGKRPLIYQEVVDNGDNPSGIRSTDYTYIGRVLEFRYGKELSDVVKKRKNAQGNVQQLSFLNNFGMGWSFLNDDYAMSFIDNHDNQRSIENECGCGPCHLTFKDTKSYKLANSFMLAWPYGTPILISSYNFDAPQQGPPTTDGNTVRDVVINTDGTCGNGWICEHRWREIKNMVAFRNVAVGLPVANWWTDGFNQIAFSRGTKAFIAINNDNNKDLRMKLQTGLPVGIYCDIISGEKTEDKCTGLKITVNPDGTADIFISKFNNDDKLETVVAITMDSKLTRSEL